MAPAPPVLLLELLEEIWVRREADLVSRHDQGVFPIVGVVTLTYSPFFEAVFHVEVDCDLAGYDFLVLGFPVWAGRAATPINSFLRENDFNQKRCALFATVEESGTADSAFAIVKEKIVARGGEVIDEAAFEVKLASEEKYLENARDFARRLKSKLT